MALCPCRAHAGPGIEGAVQGMYTKGRLLNAASNAESGSQQVGYSGKLACQASPVGCSGAAGERFNACWHSLVCKRYPQA